MTGGVLQDLTIMGCQEKTGLGTQILRQLLTSLEVQVIGGLVNEWEAVVYRKQGGCYCSCLFTPTQARESPLSQGRGQSDQGTTRPR